MEFRQLGRTDLVVSRLSFGTGPLEGLAPKAGGELLVKAFDLGINLWDGSSDYGTYPHMRWALKHLPRGQVMIITKTYAENDEQTQHDVTTALRELKTDYIDILLLHYTPLGWLGRPPRLPESMLKEKESGRVRFLGLSTHSVATAHLAAEMPEVEVVETIVNRTGKFRSFRGTIDELEDGSLEEMLEALKALHAGGKGVIAIKVLGSGILSNDPASAIAFVAGLPQVDTLCIGMRSEQELEANVRSLMQARGGHGH
jgi:aryl-alcohol dehydrogenase-like predicted oxidoreductase